MATFFVLAGGLVGFVAALSSLLVLDVGFLMALAIWSGTGITMTAFGVILSLLADRGAQSGAQIEARPRIA
ncbi:MAG: hypothetical protein ACK4RZ_12450 [Paracoccaceae bacterium]